MLRYFFFFKQKTAYEMRISDWSSDVCSSDLWLRLEGDVVEADVLAVEARPVVGPQLDHRGEVLVGDLAPLRVRDPEHLELVLQIGRASCRERVCQYV